MKAEPMRAVDPLRIVLIEHPRQASWVHMNDVANTPLSSSLMTGYVAAVLMEAGHEVRVIEGHLGRLDTAAIAVMVAGFSPDVVGLHAVYDWSDGRHVHDLMAAVQVAAGPVPALLYGFYPTFAAEWLLGSLPGTVAAVLGEPEATVVEAAAALARLGPAGRRDATLLRRAMRAVPGLAVGDAAGVTLTSPRPLVDDLDRLPAPHRTPAMMALREINIAGSRGCYGGCTFCCINPFYGGRSHWRSRSPENVVAEMAALLDERPDKGRFYFVDPSFFGPAPRGRERALVLARLLTERFGGRGVRFGVEGRVDDIDDEVVAALVRAGMDEILIGLESGSDETLRRLRKRTTVEQNRRALRILRSHGVEPNVGFLMFEPQSTLADVRVNLDFLREERLLERLSITANVLYHQQIVLAPSPSYRQARDAGLLTLSAHSPYEGRLPYAHAEVEFLAETMAEVCRHVFAGLPPGAWGGDAQESGSEVLNSYLVGLFERMLDDLVAGRLRPSAEAAAEFEADARARMAALARA